MCGLLRVSSSVFSAQHTEPGLTLTGGVTSIVQTDNLWSSYRLIHTWVLSSMSCCEERAPRLLEQSLMLTQLACLARALCSLPVPSKHGKVRRKWFVAHWCHHLLFKLQIEISVIQSFISSLKVKRSPLPFKTFFLFFVVVLFCFVFIVTDRGLALEFLPVNNIQGSSHCTASP